MWQAASDFDFLISNKKEESGFLCHQKNTAFWIENPEEYVFNLRIPKKGKKILNIFLGSSLLSGKAKF